MFASLRSNPEFSALVRRLQGARPKIDWTDDFEQARVRAADEGKDLFVYFSGEDWCPWCAMLRNGVFNEPEFIDHVPETFVMVQLDSPDSGPRPPSWQMREQLRVRWGLPNSVPKFVLCDAAGRPYFVLTSRPTTADEWVEFLNSLQAIREERDGHLARAETLEGLERARALDQALVALEQNPSPPERMKFINDASIVASDEEPDEAETAIERGKYFFSEYNHVVREILALDAANEAGLKAKYELLAQTWWVAGPYPGELAASYPPEQSPDPQAPIPAAGDLPGRTWTATLAQPRDAINFLEFFGQTDGASAYALTFVDVPEEREAVLLVGSDDQVRVWLNGQLVHEYPRGRPAAPDQDLVPVTLAAGRNTILAKVVNVNRNHLLYCRVSSDPLDLARAWVRRNRRDLAEEHLDRAISADEKSWRVRVERGGIYLDAGRWDDAEADFQAALSAGAPRRLVGDSIGRVAYYASRRHETAGRLAEAARCLRRAVDELALLMREQPSSSFQAKLDLCRKQLISALARTGEHDELEALIAATSDPATTANDIAWKLATSANPAERHPQLAVTLARQAVQRAPRDGAFWNTVGAAEYRAGDWDAAIEALTKSMSFRQGGDSHDWVFLAMAHWEAGRRDEALSWYRKVVTDFSKWSSNEELRRFFTESAELLGAGDPLLRGRAYALLGNPQRALADFSGLIDEQPKNAAALIARGELHARFTRWQEAADDFEAALAVDSTDHWQWYRGACLRLKTGDREGYLRYCREMIDRFGGTDRPYISERIAKLCLLVPEAVEPAGDAAFRLAAVAASASSEDNFQPYYLLVKGLADYRAGRFQDAAETCSRSFERLPSVYAQALAAVFCGMAHHSAGDEAEARRWLALADERLDRRMPKESSGNVGPAWHDWIMPHAARDEARKLIAGEAEAKEPPPTE
ncbi:MAG TPA: tetratricopeptide repeat protein [Planctomycetaceae bacterium]|nr:tetratricopeptide repeat protein [Planctomycetaceae bacterium]